MSEEAYPWVWVRKARPRGRRGQRCRIVAQRRGNPSGIVTVEFADGSRFLVERRGLARPGRG